MKPNNQWRHWWPWAWSDWMGWLWIMNEELPDWSVRLTLLQTLGWHFNGVPGAGDTAATNKLPCRTGWERVCVWRLKCGSAQENPGLQKDQGRRGDCRGEIGEKFRHPSIKKTPHAWQLRCISGLFCTWRRRANDENKHIKQQKGATRMLPSSQYSLPVSLLSPYFLSLPLCPPH